MQQGNVVNQSVLEYYDFSGFPEWMYRLRYDAPGAPALADRVEELLEGHTDVARDDRGLDHGVWVPLIHLFPEADVPVLEISMPLFGDRASHFGWGLLPLIVSLPTFVILQAAFLVDLLVGVIRWRRRDSGRLLNERSIRTGILIDVAALSSALVYYTWSYFD